MLLALDPDDVDSSGAVQFLFGDQEVGVFEWHVGSGHEYSVVPI